MSVTVTQPEINVKETLIDNQQRYGITGKQLLESKSVSDARSLISTSRKNLIINGNFDVWQRGTSSNVATAQFAADRWINRGPATGGTGTITREVHDINNAPTDASNYFLRHDVTSASGASYIRTALEHTIAIDDPHTVSFFMRSNAPFIANIIINIYFNATEFISYQKVFDTNIRTDEWIKHTYGIVYDSSPGFVVDENARVTVQLANSSTGTMIWDISTIQFEKGNNATEFEIRPIAEELKRCQRYYQKSYASHDTPGVISTSGSIFNYGTRNEVDFTTGTHFATTMRAAPTIVLYSTGTGTAGVVRNGANGDFAATALNIGDRGFDLVSAPGITTGGTTYHYTAEAEL